MDFILPLEQQVLVTIADALWNLQCMDGLKWNYMLSVCGIRDFEVEKEVDEVMCNVLLGKISNLSLPETIKDNLVRIARNVGLQKINYYFHYDNSRIRKFPNVYHWTSRGSIDKKKTAKSLINDATIEMYGRYSLACYYCFEDEIQELSGKLSGDDKSVLDCSGDKLSHYWYATATKKDREQEQYVVSPYREPYEEDPYEGVLWIGDVDIKTYKQAFEYSLEVYNSVAAEFFWAKLIATEYSSQEREHTCYTILKEMLMKDHSFNNDHLKEHFLDVTVFLLKQMTKAQQMKTLAEYPLLTLDLFLDCPLPRLFFEIAEMVYPHVSEKILHDLLSGILERARDNDTGFDYREVFTKFWLSLSLSQRAGVINYYMEDKLPRSERAFAINYSTKDFRCLLDNLVHLGHFKNFFLMVRDATDTQKQNLIHSCNGLGICKAFIFGQEWELLKLFIDICLPSAVQNLEFKNALKRILPKEKVNDVCNILGIAVNDEN